MAETNTQLPALFRKYETQLILEWVEEQTKITSKVKVNELKTQCEDFFRLLMNASEAADSQSLKGPSWEPAKKMLNEVSRSRGLQGFTPSETATFVFSLKRPVFNMLRKEFGTRPEQLADETWVATIWLDQLGLHTTEAYQKTRDEIISRQQEEMLELSTPVVKLWDGILALPMIGTLDSSRTHIVMESLLQKIMETGSEIAIIDITGVPTVDTLVAQHLIKTVTAAKLMGAECIISGIRPQIASTIVHLGVDLGGIATKSTLADAFVLALSKLAKKGSRVLPSNVMNSQREIRA